MQQSFPEINFDATGLIPAIVQDAETKEVLMLAYMNRQSLQLTLETGETHFRKRAARGRDPCGLRCRCAFDPGPTRGSGMPYRKPELFLP
jgi:hypothetical protein